MFKKSTVLILHCASSLHFTLSLHFTPGPQFAVRSSQSLFYTDRKGNRDSTYRLKNCNLNLILTCNIYL